MKQKRSYAKPVLQSRKIQLGVFGDYRPDSPSGAKPDPVTIIERMNLRME